MKWREGWVLESTPPVSFLCVLVSSDVPTSRIPMAPVSAWHLPRQPINLWQAPFLWRQSCFSLRNTMVLFPPTMYVRSRQVENRMFPSVHQLGQGTEYTYYRPTNPEVHRTFRAGCRLSCYRCILL